MSESDDSIIETEEVVQPKKKSGRQCKISAESNWNEYRESDVRRLIQLVEETEQLWDSSHPQWHRNDLKCLAWNGIEKECRFLKQSRKKDGENAKFLFRQLSSDYKKDRIERTPRSGDGLSKRPSSFKYQEEMAFLEREFGQRSVSNTYIFGDIATEKTPSSEKTPKRERTPAEIGPLEKKKKIEKSGTDGFMEQMLKQNEQFLDILKNSETSEKSSAASEPDEIAMAVKDVMEGKTKSEQLRMKTKILNYIFSLAEPAPRNDNQNKNQQSSSRPRSPSLLDLYEYNNYGV